MRVDLPSPATPAPRRGSLPVERADVADFHRVLDAVPAGAYICDRDGLITYFNRRAAEIWGREPLLHDVRDRYCGSFRLYARDGTPVVHEQCWMARALFEDTEYNGCEIVIEQPGGRRVAVLAHANPLHGEDGELLGAVNLLTEITDRKRSERAKDDFLELLGHELRNPLGPVSNAVHILRGKSAADEQSRWALDLIERQVEDLVSLIEQVAEVSRLSRGEVTLAWSEFSVTELVTSAVENVRPLLARKKQDCAPSLPRVDAIARGDAQRLRNAVEALIHCASRSQRSGLAVQVAARAYPDRWTVLAGSPDAGQGGSSEPAAREPSNGDRARPAEMWAGLKFAELLAELHGGTLAVHAGDSERIVYELSVPLDPPPAT